MLQLGVPYSGTLESNGDASGYEWLRPPMTLFPADLLQFTLQNDGGAGYGGVNIRVCLAPSTDDFGQQDMENACDSPGYTSKIPAVDLSRGKFRRTITWSGRRTDGFILVKAGCGFCDDHPAHYTITVEAQVHKVRLGSLVVSRHGAFTIVTTAVRLTDNSAAPDGLKASLDVLSGTTRAHVVGATHAGQLALKFKPLAGAKTAKLRMCVTQVGSDRLSCSAATITL
jgi:hypothetical protein